MKASLKPRVTVENSRTTRDRYLVTQARVGPRPHPSLHTISGLQGRIELFLDKVSDSGHSIGAAPVRGSYPPEEPGLAIRGFGTGS